MKSKSKSKSKNQRSKTKRKSHLNGGYRKTKRKSRLNGGNIFNSRLLRSCSLDPPTVKFIKAYEQAGKSLDKDKHKQRFIQEDSQVLFDYLSKPNDCENERDALKRIIELFSNSNKVAFYRNYGAADENDDSPFTLAYLHVIKQIKGIVEPDSGEIKQIKGIVEPYSGEIKQIKGIVEPDSKDNIRKFVNGDLDTMEEMLKSGNITNVDVQDKTFYDYTALIYKTAAGKIVEMEWLLEKGANVNLQNTNGESAIYRAIYQDDLDKVELLLRYKADLNIKNKSGRTPLAYAIMLEKNKVIPILEEAMKS